MAVASMLTHRYANIGVVGALREEVDLVRARLGDQRIVRRARREYCSGLLGSQRVTLVESRIGKVAASITACALIEEFAVDAIIFTGVAGALSDDLEIGDIVVATEAVHHDLQGPPEMFRRGEVPLLGIRELPTDPALTTAALDAAEGFVGSGLDTIVSAGERNSLGIGRPRVHRGQVATGDEFIHADMKDVVREHAPEALCVDMEGAAVAQVCFEHDEVPVCLIRAISDHAAGDASVAFPLFLDALARHYSYEILRRMF